MSLRLDFSFSLATFPEIRYNPHRWREEFKYPKTQESKESLIIIAVEYYTSSWNLLLNASLVRCLLGFLELIVMVDVAQL
jgi:hypothetical protein